MLNTLKKYSIHALLAVGFILLSYILLQKYQFVTGIVSSTLYICFYFSLFISFFIAETYLLAKKKLFKVNSINIKEYKFLSK